MIDSIKQLTILFFNKKLKKNSLSLSLLLLVACQQKLTKQDGMILIKGGTFEMGGDNAQARADEFPKHTMNLNSFWIDETEVTNAQFKKFIEATNYITTAEKDFEYKDVNGKIIHQKAGSLVFNKLLLPSPNVQE